MEDDSVTVMKPTWGPIGASRSKGENSKQGAGVNNNNY